jgi:hypothetical protein
MLIARIIDNYLSNTNGDRKNYYKSLQFVPEKIILGKKGFLSSFFRS